jgi:hypothetical protein
MTYSYIKSVFPNFETSKVYDEKNYNMIKPISKINTEINNDSFLSQFVLPTNQKVQEKKQNVENQYKDFIEKEMLSFLEKNNYESVGKFEESKNFQTSRNNIIQSKETFQNNNTSDNIVDNCTLHLNHVLECGKCKDIFSKQLNLEFERARNEEIIEVVSYIVFGIFILLILDNISKK